MKIAYIILAHKYPDQLIRLVYRLNTSTSIFLIHIDKKTDNRIFDEIVKGLRDLENVIFLKRHKHYWGDFSHTFATLEGIKLALDTKLKFDYMFLLTGQDYPIKTNAYIREFLRKNKGKEFIRHFKIPPDPGEGWDWGDEKGGLNRIENWHIRLFNTIYRIPGEGNYGISLKSLIKRIFALFLRKRKLVDGLKLFGGSSYWCITRECTEYINSFVKNNRRFVNFFKHVGLPDEIFFQTVILNSPFCKNVVNDDLRCIDWSDGGSNPRILCKGDIAKLKKSTGLIARKFDSRVDPDVLDLIDRKLLAEESKLTDMSYTGAPRSTH